MKFGKYKNMLALDVVDLQTVNKNGETVNTGLAYLEFLCKQDWSRHTSIVQSIIDEYLEEKDVPELKEIKHPKKKSKR